MKQGDWVILIGDNRSRGIIVGVESTVFGQRYRVEWRSGLCAGDTTTVDAEKVAKWGNPPEAA